MPDDVTLRDVVRQEYVGVSESDTVAETLSLLADEEADCAVVLRGSEAIGLVTPTDLYQVLTAQGIDDTPVTEVMQPSPATAGPSDHLSAAATLLIEGDTGRVIVTDDDGVVGLVDARDVLAVKSARLDETAVETPITSAEPGGGSYSSQSICEGCGSLARDLTEFNGQLLCPDCRSV